MKSAKHNAELIGKIAGKVNYFFRVNDSEIADIVLQEIVLNIKELIASGGVVQQVLDVLNTTADPLDISPFERKLVLDEYRLLFGLQRKHDDRRLPVAESDKPWNDYNNRANPLDILVSHGWTVSGRGNKIKLTAPGKHRTKHSAALNSLGENELIVFSTNAEPFEPFKKYRPFAVYALLEHGGDVKSAIKELRSKGYGKC